MSSPLAKYSSHIWQLCRLCSAEWTVSTTFICARWWLALNGGATGNRCGEHAGPNFLAGIWGLLPTVKSSDGQSPSLGNVNKILQQRTQRATFAHEGSSPRLRCMPLMFAHEGVMCCHAIHSAVREGVDFRLGVNTPLTTVTLTVLRCLARYLEVNKAAVQCSSNRVQNCH